MALPLDVETPTLGYFVSSCYEEVSFYVVSLIRKLNRSLFFQLHCSGQFEKDGSSQECHLPILRPYILDPQMPDEMLYELLAERYYMCTETEFFEGMDGSGWNFIPGTLRFWIKLYPCQPNPKAKPNKDNKQDDDDQQDDQTMPELNHNYFLYAIMEYFARHAKLKIPRVKVARWEMLRHFKTQMGINIPDEDFFMKVDLQDLARYHSVLNALNIRVFSMRGNLLYAKKMDTDQTGEFIDLYLNSNNNFALILNLYSFFKKKHDRQFCMTCIKWVQKEKHTCEQKKNPSKSEQVKPPGIPLGRHGLVGYADFESIIKDDRHSLAAWGCVTVDKFHKIRNTDYNTLDDTSDLAKTFLEYVCKQAEEFAYDEGHETYECQICDEPIQPNKQVIIGRNFINGRQGSHHKECWGISKNTMYVFFHNFRGYDSHFLIREIVANYNVKFMSATSFEKFNCITIEIPGNELITVTFKDTFNFFTCSLAKCVSMIENWVYSPENIRDKKGDFPYDWFDDPAKLRATALPPGPWYNKLTNSCVNSEEAEKIWSENGMREFVQFLIYYLMMDILQLCDAFEEFRRICVEDFGVDPVHFQGAPALTWFFGVLHNPQMFKIIKDTLIYLDIQNGIRGGVSQAMTKYCNVENKPNESMFFLDVNSLYSKCMTYKLPGKFLEKITELPSDWPTLFGADSHVTAILVVDLHYPEHLHDRDWAYPLAPHKFNDRLCTTFKDKENYMVHAELLLFYLKRGMILVNFHYGYVFEQDYTLRDYVQTNIEKRRKTKSEVMKTLYKLLNNSLYGKTCENVNKYRKFTVVKDQSLFQDPMDAMLGQVNDELQDCFNILPCGENFLCEKQVHEVELNKPIQIGFTILEFAKREIYQFLAAVSDHFGDRVVPMYTDTDSILFWCAFPTPWKFFYNSPLKEMLDFEKVPEHWGIKSFDTDKQSGLWSPEAGGKEIVEYCGLRAKCYCYRFADNTEVVKNKGIPKAAMIANDDETPRQRITMEKYREALFDGTDYKVCQYAIRSFKHEVITKQQYKLGLSANDFKRTTTTNKAVALPFGYKGEIFRDLAVDADDPDFLDP